MKCHNAELNSLTFIKSEDRAENLHFIAGIQPERLENNRAKYWTIALTSIGILCCVLTQCIFRLRILRLCILRHCIFRLRILRLCILICYW
jgi:hypothetical protein